MIYLSFVNGSILEFKSEQEAKSQGYDINMEVEDDKYSGIYTYKDEYFYLYPILSQYKPLAKKIINLYLSKNTDVYTSFEQETFALQYKGAQDILNDIESKEADFIISLCSDSNDDRTPKELAESIIAKHDERAQYVMNLVMERHRLHNIVEKATTHDEIIRLLKSLGINPEL